MGKAGELKQLCTLGLPGEVLVPELLARLHGIADSHSNIFLWVNERYEICNAYGEDPRFFDLAALYFAEFYGRAGRDVVPSYREFMSGRVPPTLRELVADDARLYRSAFFAEIMQPQAHHDFNYLKISQGGRPLGLLILGGDARKPKITAGERKRLDELTPFFAHALSAPAAQGSGGYEDEDFGLLVLDRAGALQHASASARRLLFLAAHPHAGARELRSARLRLEAPEIVQRLRADLVAALCGNDAGRAAPSHVLHNRCGRFAFRAYPLEPLRPEESLIGVIVQRQVPAELALWRRIRALGLPPKQAEVCFHLAAGRAYAEIAEAMDVSINTVSWHVREIYARFDVHGAAELSRKLLSGGGGMQSRAEKR
jgi:DNA-binding CsgD family transcriptional regulator